LSRQDAGGEDNSISTSGVYRVTAPEVVFFKTRGPRKACLPGVKKSRAELEFSGLALKMLQFFQPRGAYVCNKPWIGSLVVLVIAASLAEAEVAVGCSANHICVPIILPVVLPPADLA
jgi:hypothetical protein